MNEIIEIFIDFETDHLPITDWEIRYRGDIIDTISLDDNGIHFWGGNPFENEEEDFEEYLPTAEEREEIYAQILECA